MYPSFSLFLVQCIKLARSTLITSFNIVLIFLESVFLIFKQNSCGISFSNFTFSLASDFSDDDSDDSSSLTDIFGPERGGCKFLDKYSIKDVSNIIKGSPINEALDRVGIDDWYVEFELSDSFNHYMYLRTHKYTHKDQYIAFLIVRVDGHPKIKVNSHSPKMRKFIDKNIDFEKLNILHIQWLSLQNPGATFSKSRPRLPGQKYPGSGIGKSVFYVIRSLCIINRRDGIMNVPEHFHNAVMYNGFFFLDPENEAHFEKMKEDLTDDIKNYGLAAVSWAVGIGALRLDGKKYLWNPGEQVYPLSRPTFAYFNSLNYTEKVDKIFGKLPSFTIDWKSIGYLNRQIT